MGRVGDDAYTRAARSPIAGSPRPVAGWTEARGDSRPQHHTEIPVRGRGATLLPGCGNSQAPTLSALFFVGSCLRRAAAGRCG
jgi:hypothetical protein